MENTNLKKLPEKHMKKFKKKSLAFLILALFVSKPWFWCYYQLLELFKTIETMALNFLHNFLAPEYESWHLVNINFWFYMDKLT